MGKWNHRWIPRRKYRNEYTDSYPPHQYQTLTPDDWKSSNVPLWEKQFCQQVCSVPWKKVLVAKKYMHCYDNVVKWNDSDSEEAFHNAKKRFQAVIDSLPCDLPLPDPNMYIDEIDWNPEIDPKLIVDLERAFFNPDEGEKVKKVENVKRVPHSCNPWERSILEATEAALNDVAQGRNQWGGSIDDESNKRRNNANTNPWEQIGTHVQGGKANDNPWLSCNTKSWGWNQKGQVDDERPWSNNFQNNYMVQNQINNDTEYLDSSRGGGVSGGGQWRKREGSHQYSSRNKSPRFDRDDWTGNRHWRNGNNRNRFNFP